MRGVDLRDVQIAARHADPCTTMPYDRARANLDRHPIMSGRLHGLRHLTGLGLLRPGPQETPAITDPGGLGDDLRADLKELVALQG